jgi:hypothetical protein
MIDRIFAVDKFIVSAINDSTVPQKDKDQLDVDCLTEQDSAELKDLHALLEPFYWLSKGLQGNIANERMCGAILDVLPAVDVILERLEDAKRKLTDYNSLLATCINMAWAKLNHYYTQTDKSPVYMVAVLLDPRMKM